MQKNSNANREREHRQVSSSKRSEKTAKRHCSRSSGLLMLGFRPLCPLSLVKRHRGRQFFGGRVICWLLGGQPSLAIPTDAPLVSYRRRVSYRDGESQSGSSNTGVGRLVAGCIRRTRMEIRMTRANMRRAKEEFRRRRSSDKGGHFTNAFHDSEKTPSWLHFATTAANPRRKETESAPWRVQKAESSIQVLGKHNNRMSHSGRQPQRKFVTTFSTMLSGWASNDRYLGTCARSGPIAICGSLSSSSRSVL
ncbi:hypothetical protein CCHR01_13830 [Colletotrichum chrysophilum]|uniref:Uncharacterized protein n=1 Tax=Colletotrichum chrysophilum TaxID=1836956 RepID=A0AAD9ECT9_9PEZI|nr:hypothetical protein CCHR01_13830 [Colletotrichum chrysophilum]